MSPDARCPTAEGSQAGGRHDLGSRTAAGVDRPKSAVIPRAGQARDGASRRANERRSPPRGGSVSSSRLVPPMIELATRQTDRPPAASTADPAEWVSQREALRILGISREAMAKLRDELPVRRIEIPGTWARYHRGDLERLVAASIKGGVPPDGAA